MHANAPLRPEETAALRAEHDVLATQLESRRSIDLGRRALYLVFGGVLGAGTAATLAWDRWGALKPGVVRKAFHGPPLFLYLAIAVTAVLLALGVRFLVQARRFMKEEDALFARFRQLRDRLGLDP
jgi:hypothetical protein